MTDRERAFALMKLDWQDVDAIEAQFAEVRTQARAEGRREENEACQSTRTVAAKEEKWVVLAERKPERDDWYFVYKNGWVGDDFYYAEKDEWMSEEEPVGWMDIPFFPDAFCEDLTVPKRKSPTREEVAEALERVTLRAKEKGVE